MRSLSSPPNSPGLNDLDSSTERIDLDNSSLDESNADDEFD